MQYGIIIVIILAITSCMPVAKPGLDSTAQEGQSHIGEEIPRVDTTIWTERTELFVEFPVLIVDKISRFATHFTVLDGHQPVREGQVTVSLVKGQKGIRQMVETPSPPGIFNPSLQPKEAGVYQLIFDLKTPDFEDRILLDRVRVYTNEAEAIDDAGGTDETGNTISFLKEQAWRIEFQTALVKKGEIFDVVHTSGVWKAAPNAFKSLVANSSGIVEFADRNLTVGAKVYRGQVLMHVSSGDLTSDNLDSEIEKAKVTVDQLKLEYERKLVLQKAKIIPSAELEQVEARYKVAETYYKTLNAGYTSGGKQIKASFDGFIRSLNINNGDYAAEGTSLVTIGTYRSRLLEVQVNPADISHGEPIHNIWYQPRTHEWSNINESGGSLISIGKEVAQDQPLLALFAQITEEVAMPQGSFTKVQIEVGNQDRGLLVPESALLEDYGNYSVIVQLEGETFERRPVITGRRNGMQVEIKSGLNEGEVVVTKGAYQVKMASMSGQTPAHGHAH
ncbi:MAG: efflux RND transporter periplasmic adaptor subunit [Saprospiraceae bacterium]|nr:efflux RND transporter periplasmic adaptor subunit [Saprospiraceae bacterium]